ncbi:aldo/keto reductase [Rhizomonospora bruguierae]|uniref:aldo/keto reductase n=1 Tax=Rhizomonospora bruguierae TaxID=1581705 RepID=UPI001BCA8D2E|nr:aldo/keto reductase [Micromonospora sp. NBRC 107566]
MERIELGGTGPHTGRIILGTMTFGAQVDEREAELMLRAGREAGITMFDTSNNYNGGRSEAILGRIIKRYRDDVLISTKGGSTVEQADDSIKGLGRKALTRAVDGSLKRLGVDHIDLYYLHRPDRSTPIEETLETLSELVAAGKIRQLGQSNFAAWQITEINYLARAHGWPEMPVSQQMYSLVARRIEAEYVEAADRLGLTTIVYNPLAGGLLTGKHRLDSTPAVGSRFAKETYRERYWNRAQFVAVERLRNIARQAGLSLLELALRWVLGRPATHAVLLGASSLEQLRANLAAINGPPLDEATLAACDVVWNEGPAGSAPAYNR